MCMVVIFVYLKILDKMVGMTRCTEVLFIVLDPGGARSLSVFDNDIGSGSVSPLILTGGKGGDVGLHDFRYIATGRTKKHKHLDPGDHNMNASSSVDMRSKTGDQNRNGMLWYIPKAHSGTVTCILVQR